MDVLRELARLTVWFVCDSAHGPSAKVHIKSSNDARGRACTSQLHPLSNVHRQSRASSNICRSCPFPLLFLALSHTWCAAPLDRESTSLAIELYSHSAPAGRSLLGDYLRPLPCTWSQRQPLVARKKILLSLVARLNTRAGFAPPTQCTLTACSRGSGSRSCPPATATCLDTKTRYSGPGRNATAGCFADPFGYLT
jgi:hypothetical protein